MDSLPLWLNAVLFLPAAAAIWWAGTRLERLADVIARRTGLGHAFTGMLFLAAATSLPEVATTVTAILLLDNPTLAVHNLLGGVAMQTAILVVADRATRTQGALTYFSPRFVLLVEGLGLVLLLQITIAGIAAEGVPVVASVSLWLVLLVAAYVAMMFFVYKYQGRPRWTPSVADDFPSEREQERRDDAETEGAEDERSTRRIWMLFGVMSLVVLAGGWAATHTAEVLAEQTGLGPAFLGATLLAVATSLPELSTTIAAGRQGRYTVAISNVFGSNAFDVSLLLVADVLWRGGSVLQHAEMTVVFVSAVGAIMTCLYLWGLMEHDDKTVLGIGTDSAAVLAVYVAGMTVLYFMQ